MSGAIVVHTAENNTDTSLPDGGAEAVAGFISRRRDAAGSYHSIVDSDSTVHVGHYEWEMFHDGTGGNRWSLGLSFACRASQWSTLPEAWFNGALRNGAVEAASMARWVQSTVGVAVPAERITAAEYRSAKPGFISHGELDPGRRSDPGVDFPWSEFLALFQAEIRPTETPAMSSSPEASMLLHRAMAEVDELYRAYRGARPSLAERRTWGQDLAQRIYSTGDDPRTTLAFIEFTLRQDLNDNA
ncbi:MAG: N-acetylmuramoyl-L-alanine amidase [Actinomycetia bacterium]|nr:N-acetylmuramoyl-L-alanine amidase [Actinomycetes bacterium]